MLGGEWWNGQSSTLGAQGGERLLLHTRQEGSSRDIHTLVLKLRHTTLTTLSNGTIAPPQFVSILAEHMSVREEWLREHIDALRPAERREDGSVL